MKKLLFVINTLGTAGAEKALLRLLEKIDYSMYQVDLMILLNQGELINEIPEKVHVLNDKYDNCPIYGKRGKRHLFLHVCSALLNKGCIFKFFGYLIKNFLLMKKNGCFEADKLLWQAVAYSAMRVDTEYDMAIAYIEGGSTYYVSNYVKAKRKVAFLHVDYQEAGYFKQLDQGAYENIDRIYTVSDEVRESFLKVYSEYLEKVRVFHNLIDIEAVEAKSQKSGGFSDAFTGTRLLTVGRLCAQKAFEYSIEAMELLKKSEINVKWYVLGSGDEEEKLKRMISEKHLENDFLLLGNQSNPYPFYRQCDIYVHASKFEGKSIAVQEAQALSKPIIVSDCAGNREQVIHMYDGMMCELDSAKIAEAIMYMINNKDEAAMMGKRAFERISSETAKNNELENMLNMA